MMKFSLQDRVLKVDLHIHSTRSDGSYTYKEIVDYASRIGLKAISITDHDDISDLEFAEQYCLQKGLELITGIEISARTKTGAMTSDLHLLGYFFNYHDQRLHEYIDYFQDERRKRAQKILRLLKNHGIDLAFKLIELKAGPGSIGRPHIAEAMVEQGYVHTYQEAFDYYIGDTAPCFVPKYKITPAEAIALINNAGGICFIAHPGMDVTDDNLMNLIKDGLEGIETIHPRHTQAQVDHYREIIRQHGLLETGGSDFHGERKLPVQIGHFNIPYTFVENMKAWLGRRYSPG